jgi:hypothetical protein
MRARAVQLVSCALLGVLPVCAAVVPARGCEDPPPVVQPVARPAVDTGILGAGQRGVVTGFQDQVLSRSASREAAPGGAGAGFPTGRLGESWHGAYIDLQPSPWPGYKSQTSEASALASGYYNVPQSVFGGSVQAGVFGGESWVRASFRPASPSLATAAATKASNSSSLFGGYVLYSSGRDYAMNTVSVFEGTTAQTGAPFAGSSAYGTHGFVDTAVAGHVFDVSGAARSLKLDVRGGLLYSAAHGDPFSDNAGQRFRSSTGEWTASVSATLFRDIAIWGDETLRPYVKAGLKEQLGYSNKVEVSYQGAVDTYRFGQSPTLGNAEIGFDYIRSNVTVTGAVYGEMASGQSSLGGRLWAKFAF